MTGPRTINVLLVEDTEEHAVLMKRALERGRLVPRLFWVKDGKEALDFLYHQGVYADAGAYPRPEVVLLDLKLPKISGLEILQNIRGDEQLKNVPVVILTASDEDKDIIKSYQEGANSYFTKSVLFLNKGAGPTSILETVMAMAGV
jgi:CheY-like chemotaxis protein